MKVSYTTRDQHTSTDWVIHPREIWHGWFWTGNVREKSAGRRNAHGWSSAGVYHPEGSRERRSFLWFDRQFKSIEHDPWAKVKSGAIYCRFKRGLVLFGAGFKLCHIPLVGGLSLSSTRFPGVLSITGGLFPRTPLFSQGTLGGFGSDLSSIGSFATVVRLKNIDNQETDPHHPHH